jgi:hypothetical protein
MCWLLALALLCATPGAAQTPEYPSKPIRFLVGVAPGGGTDFVARLIAVKLTEKFGQPGDHGQSHRCYRHHRTRDDREGAARWLYVRCLQYWSSDVGAACAHQAHRRSQRLCAGKSDCNRYPSCSVSMPAFP